MPAEQPHAAVDDAAPSSGTRERQLHRVLGVLADGVPEVFDALVVEIHRTGHERANPAASCR